MGRVDDRGAEQRDTRVSGRLAAYLPRVLVIEDDRLVFRHWERLLAGHALLSLALTFDAAWQQTDHEVWRADSYPYVFLDLHLPDGNGVDLLERFAALDPRPTVAVLSGFLDSQEVLALHGRCTIAVPKPADADVLVGILSILQAARSGASRVGEFAAVYRLSHKETCLLQAAVRDASNKEAADELGCAEPTVRSYWRRIFEKTGRHSAREVVTALFHFAVDRSSSPPARLSYMANESSVPSCLSRPRRRSA